MADSYGPFDGAPWTQAQWYGVAKAWSPSGVIGTVAAGITSGAFAVTSSGLSVTVAALGNTAWIRGAGYQPDTNKSLNPPANTNATLSRRDRVVFRRDLSAKTVTIALLQGTPAASPTAPALTQSDTGIWEDSIASFLVPPNSATTLSGFMDERTWIDPAGGGYASFYADGTNASMPLTTIPTAPSGGATVTVPAGTYDIDIKGHFALSVSTAGRVISLALYSGATSLFETSFSVTTAAVTASRDQSDFTRLTFGASTTLALRAFADATGGTQSLTANSIRAVRVS